jgi:hypothetical protein
MRWLLAPGALAVAMLGLASPLTCDSGSIAKAEEALAVPYVQPDWLMRELRLLSEQNHRRHALPQFTSQPGYQSYFPRGPHETQREPPTGDFWTRDELRRYFGQP